MSFSVAALVGKSGVFFFPSIRIIGMPVFFYMSSLNRSEHRTIERSLVVMGCVLDLVRG